MSLARFHHMSLSFRQAQQELHMFMCSSCGYTLFPARQRLHRDWRISESLSLQGPRRRLLQ